MLITNNINMSQTNIYLENETEKDLNELRLKVQKYNDCFKNISKKDIIDIAVQYANKYYGLQDYGNDFKEIEEQLINIS